MPFYTYILQSKVNDSFYKGFSSNLSNRVKSHNQGLDTYTKKFMPWDLVWYTTKNTKSEAQALERKLKNLSTEKIIEFIRKYPVPYKIGELVIAPVRSRAK